MKRLPKQIYVTQEKDGNDTFLIATDDINDVEPDQITGIYKLINTGTIIEERQFISKGEI